MKITKRQLRRIIREQILHDQAPGKVAATSSGAYVIDDQYVSDEEDHPLDQLQDIIDMGVTAVTDNDTDGETYPIQRWTQGLVALKAEHDADWGPPTRWKG